MSRSHHIAKITSGAAIEHVRSYLLSEAARLGLGEEVDAADCRKLLALLQDNPRTRLQHVPALEEQRKPCRRGPDLHAPHA